MESCNRSLTATPCHPLAMKSLEELLAAGRTREARAQAEKVLRAAPDNPSALLTLTKALLVEGELAQAEEVLARLEKHGTTVDTVLARAHLAVQRAEGATARALYQQAISMGPVRAEAFFGLGVVLAGVDEFDASLKMFERAVELEPRQGMFHYHLAQNYLALGRGAEAMKHVVVALERNPMYPPAYLLLSRMLTVAGKAEDAARLLKEGLKQLPNDPRLLSALTNVDLLGGDVGGAFQAAAKLAREHPSDPAAMGNLASLLLAQRRFAEALEICLGMDAQGLSTAPLKCIEATLYEARKPPDMDAAVRAYEQAMAIDGKDWVSANNLGQLLMRRGDKALVPRAIAVLEEALRRKPEELEPMLNLAIAYARANEKQKSRELALRLLAFKLPESNSLRQQAERLIDVLSHR